MTAVASGNYVFSGWSDGYTGITRTDSVTGNTEYIAYFHFIESSTITQPITASSFGTGVVTIAGTGNLDDMTVMLAYS